MALFAGIVGKVMALGMVGTIAAGGANVYNQKKELCQNIKQLQGDIDDYVKMSKQSLEEYNEVREELRQQLSIKQGKIAENSSRLAAMRKKWETTYQYSQYVCMAVFVFVAFLLYLKHNKVLSLNPLQTK
jgi:ElaB/YqjD/DUF883 family membrane-anchored ribosome-binding protein